MIRILKSQKGFAPIFIVIGVLIIGGLVVGAYYFGRSINKVELPINKEQPTPSHQVTQSSQDTDDTQVENVTPDAVPKPNALYLGKYQGQDAVFVTNGELGKYYEQGVEKFSENKGSWIFSSGIGQQPSDYKDLQNPRRILSLSNDVLQINNFQFSDDRKFIYLSIMLKTKTSNPYPDNVTNHIYRVNVNNLKEEELWVHDMSPGKYKNAGGATTINKVSSDNNYLVLSIYDCFACEGSEAGLIILNNQTKKEKYFEKIGNVQFNLQGKVFTYQKLAPSKVPCGSEGGPGCDENNQRTVYKPVGEVLAETLP